MRKEKYKYNDIITMNNNNQYESHTQATLRAIMDKFTEQYITNQNNEWDNVPAADDRWTELKELISDWPGTPMEKLAAIERFIETH